MTDRKIYIVETVSMFRIRYAVACRSAEHAGDTVTMQEAPELSQEHLTETITSIREVDQAEYLRVFNEDNDYLSSWTEAQKLNMIHTVDYDQG